MKRFLVAVAATALIACGGDEGSTHDQAAMREMTRLGVHTTGPLTELSVTLPAPVDDAEWGPKAQACLDGGYDLGSAAGAEVLVTCADLPRTCHGEPAVICVVTRGDSVVCAYKAVTLDSQMAPGVWPANDPECLD